MNCNTTQQSTGKGEGGGARIDCTNTKHGGEMKEKIQQSAGIGHVKYFFICSEGGLSGCGVLL